MIDSSASCSACPVRFLQANLNVRSTCFMGRQDRNEKFGKGFQGKRKQARKLDRGIVKC